MLLVLPILIPLATAIALSLLPQRPQVSRAVAFAGAVGILAAAIALLARVEAGGIQVAPDWRVAGAVRDHAGGGPLQRAAGGDGRHRRPWWSPGTRSPASIPGVKRSAITR